MTTWSALFEIHWERWFSEPLTDELYLAQREKVLFVFRRGEINPRLIVKVARDEWDRAGLEREWRMLREIHARWPHLAETVPRPLLLTQWGARPALIETAVDGFPWLSRFIHRDSRRAKPLQSALRWLWDFQAATRHQALPDPQYPERIVQRWGHLAVVKESQRLIEAIYGLWDRTASRYNSLPYVWCHGDLQIANLLLGDRLRVIDWEQSSFHRLPHFDLMYLLLSFHSLNTSQPIYQAWWELFVEKPNWVQHVFAEWMHRLTIHADVLPALLGLFLLEWATVELDFLKRDYRRGYLGQSDPPEEALGSIQTIQQMATQVDSEAALLHLLGGW